MTRKSITVQTDLFGATRQGCSVNGNPRWDLHTSDGTYRTQSDSACSYDVDNIRRTIPRGEMIPIVLHTTPAGRVWKIERRTSEDAAPAQGPYCTWCGESAHTGPCELPDSEDSAPTTYSLAEIRNGTGFPRGARFAMVTTDA